VGVPALSLDARSPWVVDTRELGRRPGSMRRYTRSMAAPGGLGTDVYGVPLGSELELDLRLEALMEGVLVSGTLRGRVAGECVRCLDPVERALAVEFQELYVYPVQRGHDDEDAAEMFRLEGDLLDLEPAARDAVVLALPFQPVCRDDCPGLCSECGARLADDPGHQHEAVDPRWAALRELQDGARAHRNDEAMES
jgi:uncharacterized protein